LFLIGTFANSAATVIRPDLGPELLALTYRRLDELDRLKDLAYDRLGMIARATQLLSPDDRFRTMVAPSGAGRETDRLLRSIRQIMVLEFELRGLFQAPGGRDAGRKLRLVKSDRPGFVPPSIGKLDALEDLLDIRPDYRNGPLDEVVGSIRKVVGAEPPADDPFAPPAETAPEAVAPAPAAAPPRGPEYYMRSKPIEPEPVSAQDAPSMKAAELVITRLDGKGFRTPSKARMKKLRQGRGPPK